MSFLLLLFSLIVIFVPIFVFWSSLDMLLGGEDFATNRLVVKSVASILKMHGKERSVLYDLGSARGSFVFKVRSACPLLKLYGVDDSLFRVFLSRLKALFYTGPQFIKADIFKVNIAHADVVYIYLDQGLMLKLEQKLLKEMKAGSIVITNSVSFPHWHPKEIHVTNQKFSLTKKLFVYSVTP